MQRISRNRNLKLNMKYITLAFTLIAFLLLSPQYTWAAGDGHDHSGHNHDHHDHSGHKHDADAAHDGHAHGHDAHKEKDLNVGEMVMHHITDAHEYHLVGDFSIPLPCIAFVPGEGLQIFLSSKFHHGHNAYNGFVSDHGFMKRVEDPNFPQGEVTGVHVHAEDTKDGEVTYVEYQGKKYKASTSGYYDFSITKVVFVMLLTALLMLWLFTSIANAYKKRSVPKGKQSFFEPLIVFVRDEIAKPNLGDKYERYLPFLLTVFFFIWILNMLGLIAPFGSPNVTGNIMVTAALALFTFIITTVSANKDYWMHIFWPPGVPIFVKPILIIIEFVSMFIKPAALMIRLFANISAGHIMVLCLVGIIFIFGQTFGAAGGYGSSIFAGAFMLFIGALEIFVAALQAYIFTVLSAVFIGQAVEEHEHHHEEAHR